MLDAIGRRPWAGFGWNQLGAADYLVAVDQPCDAETLAQSHNLVLDLLVWNGIPLGTLLVLVLAAWVVTTFLRCNTFPKVLAFTSVVVVFLHAMLEFPPVLQLLSPASGSMDGCSLQGWLEGAVESAPSRLPGAGRRGRWCARVATAIDYFGLEEDVRRMRFHQAHIGAPAEGPGGGSAGGRSARLRQKFSPSSHTSGISRWKRERKGCRKPNCTKWKSSPCAFPRRKTCCGYAAALALNHQPEPAAQVLRRICKINTADACELSQKIWTWRGREDSEIAAIPWPAH